jgi:hypothetical protein
VIATEAERDRDRPWSAERFLEGERVWAAFGTVDEQHTLIVKVDYREDEVVACAALVFDLVN